MNLVTKKDLDGTFVYTLRISAHEMLIAQRGLSRENRLVALPYFDRPDATIEESLMGLQLLARAVEEAQVPV